MKISCLGLLKGRSSDRVGIGGELIKIEYLLFEKPLGNVMREI
jgi:hypothetical protein